MKVVIISEDICFRKKTQTILQKFSPAIMVTLLSLEQFINNCFQASYFICNDLYIMDLEKCETKILKIITMIHNKDPLGKIALVSFNEQLISLLTNQEGIIGCFHKGTGFQKKLLALLANLKNEPLKIELLDNNTQLRIKKELIINMQEFPTQYFSLSFEKNHQLYAFLFQDTLCQLKTMLLSTPNSTKTNHNTETHYPKWVKRLVVYLHLFCQIDTHHIVKYFHIETQKIESWSKQKELQKISFRQKILLKYLFKNFFFHHK